MLRPRRTLRILLTTLAVSALGVVVAPDAAASAGAPKTEDIVTIDGWVTFAAEHTYLGGGAGTFAFTHGSCLTTSDDRGRSLNTGDTALCTAAITGGTVAAVSCTTGTLSGQLTVQCGVAGDR